MVCRLACRPRPGCSKLGAVLIRTETELVLKSRWVQPRKLLDAGFVFRRPESGSALKEITGRQA